MRVLEKNMMMLKAMGFWIDRNEPRRFVHYIKRGLVHNVGLYAFYGAFYGLPMYIYKHSDNFSEVSESLGNGVGATIITTIYLTLVIKNDELTDLVQLLRNIDELYQPTNEHTRTIYEKTKKLCWFWSVTVPKASFVTFAFLSVLAGIDVIRERDIENRIKFIFPFDVKHPGAFALAALSFTCNFSYGTLMSIGFNLMILCMFLNIVGQLKILNYNLSNLRSSAEAEVRGQQEGTEVVKEKSTTETELCVDECLADTMLIGWKERLQQSARTQKGCHHVTASGEGIENEEQEETKIRIKMEDLLRECIAHHCHLLKCIRAFNQQWNALFSMNVVNCLAQSVLILTSSAMRDGSSNLFVHFGIAGSFYSMLGTFCYMSQQVTLQTDLLKESIYGCDWIKSSKSFKKSIGIMISVSNQPIVIKAAGFVPLSLDTFQGVLNSAYSYYMVLNSI